jgi:two-component system sensor histidine kinase EvgS
MDSVQAKPIDFNELLMVMEKIVPKGCGTLRTVLRFEIEEPTKVNFAPLDGFVDYQRAIKSWRDPVAYARALNLFAKNCIGDAGKIRDRLLTSPNDEDPARVIVHALKGVAGNLYITHVADLAIKIDANLKFKQHKAVATELAQLESALTDVASAIGKILPDEETSTVTSVFDQEKVKDLCAKLSIALKALNPDDIEPILSKLGDYVPKTDMLPIQKAVEAFDFDLALEKIEALSTDLELNLG